MGLFKLSDLPEPAPLDTPAAGKRKRDAGQPMQPLGQRVPLSTQVFATCPTRHVLKDHIGAIQPGECYLYLTGGKWSNHQLLQYLLERTGPAAVTLTTWTITERPVRILKQLMEEGTITELTMLTDHRIKSRCAAAWQLMQTLPATVHLSKCHAKITVVRNEHHGLVVISSQNFTSNPRIEAGSIFYDLDTAREVEQAIKREVFTHELVP